MAVYGPSTGHFSNGSISAARKTGGKGGSKLSKDSNGRYTVYTPDSSGLEDRYQSNSSGGGYDNLMSAYEKRQQEIMRQQQEALRQRVEQNVGNLESQKGTVNAGFDDAARQAYIMKMQNQKALPEQMAASGQTGGATESSNLAIGTNYQNNLNDINTNRTQAISGIDSAINNVRADGNIEAANLAASNAQSMLEAYMQMQQNKLSMEQQAKAEAKSDFINTLGGTPDFQAQINRIQKSIAAGDNSEAWKLPYYQQGRVEKVSNMQAAYEEAEQRRFENNLQLDKLAIQKQNAAVTQQRLAISQQNAARSGNSNLWNQAYKLWTNGRNDPWILNALNL